MKKIFILLLISLLVVACNEQSNTTPPTPDSEQQASNNDNNASNEPAIVEITEEWGNKMCPVMPEDAADKEKFAVYEGKKVYFCCDDCISTFEKDPKKYHDFLAKASQK